MFHAVKVRTANACSKNKIRAGNPMRPSWDHLKKLALGEVEATLAALPGPLRERAVVLPVTFEHAPNAAFVAEGIEPDTLGVFTGPAFADEELSASPLPPQIILFLANLWDFAEDDEDIFVDEVHTTYLHELGHYLGLDEDDLFERGLD
jgi:predicted Zn-dependent protease with MMP-like domain